MGKREVEGRGKGRGEKEGREKGRKGRGKEMGGEKGGKDPPLLFRQIEPCACERVCVCV